MQHYKSNINNILILILDMPLPIFSYNGGVFPSCWINQKFTVFSTVF